MKQQIEHSEAENSCSVPKMIEDQTQEHMEKGTEKHNYQIDYQELMQLEVETKYSKRDLARTARSQYPFLALMSQMKV